MKAQNTVSDQEDYSVVKFGACYMLRGKLGRYLTAAPEEVATATATGSTNALNTTTGSIATVGASMAGPLSSAQQGGSGTNNSNARIFNLGVDGQGVGDPLDCICFTNIDNKYGKSTPSKSSFDYYHGMFVLLMLYLLVGTTWGRSSME